MVRYLVAFLLRLAVSTGVLMLSVAWVDPSNPNNTFGRAIWVSLFLALASFVTLARFLWILLFPWLLYAAIWIVTIMGAYGLGFFRSLLLSIALTILSFLVSLATGLRRL